MSSSNFPTDESAPWLHIDHIEKFATYLYTRMLSKKLRIGRRIQLALAPVSTQTYSPSPSPVEVVEERYEILADSEDGISLNIKEILANRQALTELLKYAVVLYDSDRDDYEDDAVR